MKVLFLTSAGEMLGLAERVGKDHDVKVFVSNSILSQLAGIGRVTRVSSWRPEMAWADLIVADYTLSPAEQTAIRDRGRLLFGVGAVDLENLITSPSEEELSFQVTGFWNGLRWIDQFFYSLSQNRLLMGDLGPWVSTGMNTHVWPMQETPPVELRQITAAIGEQLIKSNYHGAVTIELSQENDTLRVTDVHQSGKMMCLAPIFGLIKDDPIEVLVGIASGGMTNLACLDRTAVATRLYGPPWPYMLQPGVTIEAPLQINTGALSKLWLIDTVLNNDEIYFGASGSLGIAVSAGRRGQRIKDHFREAQRRLDHVISGVQHPLLQYRIGMDIRHDYKTLRQRGYV